jgi:hypothetical protein
MYSFIKQKINDSVYSFIDASYNFLESHSIMRNFIRCYSAVKKTMTHNSHKLHNSGEQSHLLTRSLKPVTPVSRYRKCTASYNIFIFRRCIHFHKEDMTPCHGGITILRDV